MLGAGSGDADDVHLLEGVVADQCGRHLAGDDHQRDGIHVGSGDAGHRIGGAGTGGGDGNTDPAGGPGIAVGRMDAGLLVAGQDMMNVLEREQFVIEIDDRAAGIAEDRIHPFHLETFQQYACAVHFHK